MTQHQQYSLPDHHSRSAKSQAPALEVRQVLSSIRIECVLVIDAKRRILVFLPGNAITGNQQFDVLPIKHRNASSGVQTIGSLRTLKLVLTRTGQPVRALKAESNAW
jgi:hypothetical protein